jgi:hypothetical protein
MDNTIREYISYDMSNEIFKDSKWDYSFNTTYCASNEDWEPYYPCGEKGYFDLLIADRDQVNSVFRSNIPSLQNQRITKHDLYVTFKNTIETNALNNWTKLDKAKFSKKEVLDVINFEYLYKGIISTKSSNNALDIKWWNLCYLYGISHHYDVPFDLNEIKSYTPESFYNDLETKSNNGHVSDYWKRELAKNKDKKNEFYAYMRIIHFVKSRRNQ